MYNRHHQFNVTHSFATNFLLSYFNTAAVAHDTFITDTLVLSASTFVILYRSKNSFAEQTITFWFVGTIVNRFGLQHFTKTSFQDTIRGSQTDSDFRKSKSRSLTIVIFSVSHIFLAFSCEPLAVS